MSVHILISSFILISFVWSVFSFRRTLKLVKPKNEMAENEVAEKEGSSSLLRCYKLWFFSVTILLPFSFSRLLPITYYLFEDNRLRMGLEWYFILHTVLLGVAVYGMFSIDAISSSLKLNGDLSGSFLKEITIGKAYLVAVWGFLVLWLIVGMQYSLFESNQPSPQALVTYSPLRFIHWLSVVGYVATTLPMLFYLRIARRKFRWWLILMAILFVVLLWSSLEDVSNSLVSGCYTLWCKYQIY